MENNRLKYYEDAHLYLLDDLIVLPSVTQILQMIFPDKYKDVPKWILNKKADYGTEVHQAIEMIEKNEEPKIDSIYISEALKQYWKIKEKNHIEVIEQEQIVGYKDLYAGRFDIYGKTGEILSLFDIKTTSELDIEYCKYQLNLYRFAHKNKKKIKKLYVIHLPKGGLGKLVEVDVMNDKEIEKILKEYVIL